MKRIYIAAAGAVLLLAACVYSAGAAVLIKETWEDGNAAGWAAKPDTGVASYSDAPSHETIGGDGALRLHADNSAGGPRDDLIYTDAGSPAGLAGNKDFSGAWRISFSLYQDAANNTDWPSALSLYFWSDRNAGGDYAWFYDLTVQQSSGWKYYSADVRGGGGWYSEDAGASYYDDLADVDEIGILLTWRGTEDEHYGLDDYTVEIPEPGTCATLAFAFVSLAVPFRKKFRKKS
ncbi:MAG: hypothetical protein R6V03_11070 [Kiritimatiellia bacterium]